MVWFTTTKYVALPTAASPFAGADTSSVSNVAKVPLLEVSRPTEWIHACSISAISTRPVAFVLMHRPGNNRPAAADTARPSSQRPLSVVTHCLGVAHCPRC